MYFGGEVRKLIIWCLLLTKGLLDQTTSPSNLNWVHTVCCQSTVQSLYNAIYGVHRYGQFYKEIIGK